ncbi:uncharacterized protein [Asterias amurensis]|uniref:uncharacterized protein n=1 Tax=Asterias amurensis TaxID=7602 RepID=UPI003AB7EF1B
MPQAKMQVFGNRILLFVSAFILPISLAIILHALPLGGEMCSAMISATEGKNRACLQRKTVLAFGSKCRQPDKKMHVCEYFTEPSKPHTFRYIMGPLSMPFKLDFKAKTFAGLMIALAERNATDTMFAEINIGGWSGSKSVIRACHSDNCTELFGEHNEPGIVNENEFRPFWIEYIEGVVKVGKGGQQTAFSQWDAGQYHGCVTTEVYVGISGARNHPDNWVFNTTYVCK